MIARYIFIVTIFVIVIGVSCSKVSLETLENARFITDEYNEWEKAINARDIDWWSSFLAPNAVFLPPDSPPLETNDAIRAYKWTKVTWNYNDAR